MPLNIFQPIAVQPDARGVERLVQGRSLPALRVHVARKFRPPDARAAAHFHELKPALANGLVQGGDATGAKLRRLGKSEIPDFKSLGDGQGPEGLALLFSRARGFNGFVDGVFDTVDHGGKLHGAARCAGLCVEVCRRGGSLAISPWSAKAVTPARAHLALDALSCRGVIPSSGLVL